MRRRILTISSVSAIGVLGLCYQLWRHKATPWHGQNLRLERSVPADFDLLVLGDVGSGNADQLQVAQAAEKLCNEGSVQGALLLGDNFYPHGVENQNDSQWKDKFLVPYGSPCLRKLEFFASLGNHDYQGSTAAQINFHSEAPIWTMPHRFYSLEFNKQLKFVVIDTNILDACGLASHCTLDFLRESFNQSPVPTIVMGHHPLASSSRKYSKEPLQGRILRSMLCNKAKAYLAGHAHHLEHLFDSNCQLHEIVNGAGGAALYPLGPIRANSLFAKSIHGLMRLRVKGDHATLEFFDQNAQSIYQHAIF